MKKSGKKGQCSCGGCFGGGSGGSPFPFNTIMLGVFLKDRPFKSTSPFLIRQIEYYQRFIDPEIKKKLHVKRICKYRPTCSEYASKAIKRHGAVKGLALAAFRLLRCNPFSNGGYDPVKP